MGGNIINSVKCPMTKDLSKDCIKDNCAWYDHELNECCIKNILFFRILSSESESRRLTV